MLESTQQQNGLGPGAYALAVDLGTTFTAAATFREGRVEMFGLGNRAVVVPSLVFVGEDGSVLVGEAAARRGLLEPERLGREFKRRLGDPVPLLLGGAPFSAQALSAHLLRWILDRVTEREGAGPAIVALTHPASWGPYRLELLGQAARLAGLDEVVLVPEPTAAAIHYSTQERVDVGSVVAVYDLGGGTFDAAVLAKTESGFEVLGLPEGIEHLGGVDFDQAVYSHVMGALPAGVLSSIDVDDPAHVAALARLRHDCVEAKEALSGDTAVRIPVLLPGVHTEVSLTRPEFERMVRPAIDESLGALERAVRSAGADPSDVHRVLLVGGSSRIPLVAEMVSRALRRPVGIDAHPKHAIALGAASAAAQAPARTSPPPVPAPAPVVPESPAEAGPGHEPEPGPEPVVTVEPHGPDRPRRGRGSRVALVAAVVGLLGVIAAVAILAGRGSEDGDDASTGARTEPSDVWAAAVSDTGGLVKLDAVTGEVLDRLAIYGLAEEAVVTDEFVWVASDDRAEGAVLTQIDRAEAAVLRRIPLDIADPTRLQIELTRSGEGVWALVVPASSAPQAMKVDSDGTTTRVLLDSALPSLEPVTDGDVLWVAQAGGAVRVDPDGEQTQAVLDGSPAPGGLAYTDGRLFVVRNDAVYEIDPDTMAVTATVPITEAAAPAPLLADAQGGVYIEEVYGTGTELTFLASGVTATRGTTFLRVDAATGAVLARTDLPGAELAGTYDLRQTGPEEFWGYRVERPALLRFDASGRFDELDLPARAPGDPDLVFNGGRLVVTDLTADRLPVAYVVDPDHGEIEATVQTFLWPLLPSAALGVVAVADVAASDVAVLDEDATGVLTSLDGGPGPAVAAGDRVLLPSGDRLLVVDPDDLEATPAQIPEEASAVLIDDDQVWLVGRSAFRRVDLDSGAVLATAPNDEFVARTHPHPFTGISEAIGGGAIWDPGPTGVHRVDLETLDVSDTSTGSPPVDILVAAGSVWVTTRAGEVVRLDPATGERLESIPLSSRPGSLVAAGDTVWLVEDDAGHAYRVHAGGGNRDSEPVAVELGGRGLTTTAVAGGRLWLANEETGRVMSIDLQQAEVDTPVDVGGRPVGLAGDGDALWVALQVTRELVRLDPNTGEPSTRIPLP